MRSVADCGLARLITVSGRKVFTNHNGIAIITVPHAGRRFVVHVTAGDTLVPTTQSIG